MTKTFLEACAQGDLSKLRKMLREDAALAGIRDEHGRSAVLIAAYNGRLEVVEALIDTGVEIDIFEAAATGNIEKLRLWISRDPSLTNAFAPDGFFPLALAVFFGHAEAVDVLLEAGARVNVRSRETMGLTPLHSATAANRLDIGLKLIEAGADVKAVAAGGHTALHSAASRGNIDFVRLLLERGSDINAAMDDGKTPLAVAEERGQQEVARFLRERGARSE